MNPQSICLIATLFLVTSCSHGVKTTATYQGIGSESVTPESLKKFAPPALPAELSRKIQNYLDIRSPGLGMLTPDGKSLFFSWRVTGSSQIWRVIGPHQFPVQMTGGEDSTSLNDITRDGKFLILSRDRAGEENPGLYLQSTEGGELALIQHLSKVQTYYEGQTRDGKYLYFRANDIKPDSYAFYRYSLAEKKKELIFHEKGYWTITDIEQKSGQLLLTKYFSNNHNEVYLYHPQTKVLTPLLGQDTKTDYRVAFAPRANEYFVITPKFGDFRRLYSYRQGKWQAISPEMKAEVSHLAMDESRSLLVYSINDSGYSKIKVLSAKYLTPLHLPIENMKDIDHVYGGWISRDGTKMAVGIEKATEPKANYIYDFKTQKLTRWVTPSSPEINTKQFAKASLEYYPAKDGTPIPMFVRRPPQCPPGREIQCPVVVQFHGGPEGQSTPGFHVFSQIFIDAGFIYVEPNVRGSDGYGQKWLNADNGAQRLKVITDIEDTAHFIRKNWKVKKIGVMGGSYGGYATFYAMTRFAGAYDAGVEIVGMSNLRTFLLNTAPYRRALRIAEYGDPEKDKDALIELSPITHIDKIKAPLLMIQGVNDPRVPAGEAIQFYEAMERKGLAAELILFADEGHGASKRSNQVIQIGKTLQFFEKHLKN